VDSTRDAMNENDAKEGGRRRGRGCVILIAILVVVVGGGALTTLLVAAPFALRQDKPTDIEATIADVGLREVAVPPEFHDWRMPDDAKTPQSIASGKSLFDTQCSLCHGNTGKGDGSFGKAQFPPAANLTSDRTRTKTDGMLFWSIMHGINYTGMPGFGNTNRSGNAVNSQSEIWSMVAYIRSLQGALPTPVASK
jgi:mono/diheme cytochrome c family protein